MGLDIYIKDTEVSFRAGSYSGFMEFRKTLARDCDGIDLELMEGFIVGGKLWSSVDSDLEPLLNHSDCEGEISPNQAVTLLNGLRNYKRTGGKDVSSNADFNAWYWEAIDNWIAACEASIKLGEPIIFG